MLITRRGLFQGLALTLLLFAGGLPGLGAKEDFESLAKRALSETHAKKFKAGNFAGCVSLYAADAKFFVDHQRVANGKVELLQFYTKLREVDGVRSIEVDDFLDHGSNGSLGWVMFNYTKSYDLKAVIRNSSKPASSKDFRLSTSSNTAQHSSGKSAALGKSRR
jgi:hypothetical protein